MAGDFFALLAYMRDKIFRPLEQRTRSRMGHVQHFAMSLLFRKGSRSMTELASEMQISKQQLTPLVDKLINQGLLIKKADEHDRRIVRIEVSEQGREMLKEMFGDIRSDLVEKLSLLPEQELAELDQMLKRMLEILKSVE